MHLALPIDTILMCHNYKYYFANVYHSWSTHCNLRYTRQESSCRYPDASAHRNAPNLSPELCLRSQVALDARQAEALQTTWLQDHVRQYFTPKLLQMARDIGRLVASTDGDPTHAFPQLAGSHLSEVRHTHIQIHIK